MTNRNTVFFIERTHFSLISLLLGLALLVVSLLVFWLPEARQQELTAPLVCLSILFTFFVCVPLARSRYDGKVDWFHPSILFMLIYYTYFIFSGVWLWLFHHYDSIWVNFGGRPAFVVNSVFSLGALSIISFSLGIRTKPVMIKKSISELFSQSTQFNWKWMRYLILLFLVIGGTFKYYHFTLYGSLTIDIFRYLSPSARAALGINISQFFLMLESMLDWAALLAIFYSIVRYKQTGKKNGWWLVLLVVVLIALFDYVVSSKRSGVVPFLLLPLIWYHYIIRRLSIGRAVFFFWRGCWSLADC